MQFESCYALFSFKSHYTLGRTVFLQLRWLCTGIKQIPRIQLMLKGYHRRGWKTVKIP